MVLKLSCLVWRKPCKGGDTGEGPCWREPGRRLVWRKGLVTPLDEFGNVLTVLVGPVIGSDIMKLDIALESL